MPGWAGLQNKKKWGLGRGHRVGQRPAPSRPCRRRRSLHGVDTRAGVRGWNILCLKTSPPVTERSVGFARGLEVKEGHWI